MNYKKIFFLTLMLLICFNLSFSQEKDSLFKKSSVGVNYTLKRSALNGDYKSFLGLSYEHNIYKGLFVSTGIEFSKRYFEEEYTLYTLYGPYIYVNYEYTEYWFIAPVNFKYYFLKNSNKLLHPFITTGLYNNLIYNKGYDAANEKKIDEKIFLFNFIIGGGAEIKIINNIGFSLELLYKIPQYYNYNLKKTGVFPYNFGLKGTISYSFN
ncbi:MAG: hypothetical protein U9Q98_09420 [Bacteroidota bacterium]|nr:hypothetical protein [Bacteroidota bacterium]